MSDRPPKVLVVDDEENIRFLVESALQLAGMETAGAEDGRAGLKLAADYRPDLIVLDVVEAVDGPTDSGRCVVADRPCEALAPCALHVAWGRARRELVTSLAAMSVGALAVTA